MTRVFKTHHFQRWMRKTELTDAARCKAVQEMAAGLIDADLGGSVVKKRVGLAGRGKRGQSCLRDRSGGARAVMQRAARTASLACAATAAAGPAQEAHNHDCIGRFRHAARH